MTIRLGVLMDPIQQINYKKDSTLAMLLAASSRGWSLLYFEQKDLYVEDGIAKAVVTELTVFKDPEKWYQFNEQFSMALSELDVILMRKDPPFDNEYLYSTYILELAEKQGAMVVNNPQALRSNNEKLFATEFPQCCPPLLVTRRADLLRKFAAEQGDIILKPLDGMGGSSIFRVKKNDPNLSVIIETLTAHGATQTMAQRFIPEIVDGDKRILLVDGEPIPYALARIPAKGETRGNLAAGGTGEGRELTDRDRWICEQVAPTLKERGLLFVGIDVIGDYLTEINITSPTCIRELDNQFSTGIADLLMDAIERRVVDVRESS